MIPDVEDGKMIGGLLSALSTTPVAVCLCDENDAIQYINAAFRRRFFADLSGLRDDFVGSLVAAIRSGLGVRLQTTSTEAFHATAREIRRTLTDRYAFAVDFTDGTWWWVNDCKLPNGWILTVASDISKIKDEESRLRDAHADAIKQAQTDALTGISNRRSGMERAVAALAEFHANRLPLTIALLDIDHFKKINDTFGHAVGDEVLVHFARCLRSMVSADDHVSRLGGEEFMVVMPETSASRAQARIERIMAALGPVEIGSGAPKVDYAFSAGLATARPMDDLKSLCGRADQALYEAKAKGRGQIQCARSANQKVA